MSVRRLPVLAAALVIVALLGGALWYANRPGAAAAKAGDCVTMLDKGSFKTVGCTSRDAAFKVVAVFKDGDGNGCSAYPNVIMSVVDSGHTKTLCLEAAK